MGLCVKIDSNDVRMNCPQEKSVYDNLFALLYSFLKYKSRPSSSDFLNSLHMGIDIKRCRNIFMTKRILNDLNINPFLCDYPHDIEKKDWCSLRCSPKTMRNEGSP